jgi:anaerobic dimethyl sulfoxide reductase subunit B (iron-sulfur subunit)
MANTLDKTKVKAALKRKVAQTYEPVKPAQQFGFVHHNVDCIGCRACEIACKDKNGLPAGPRFRRVMYIEGGRYPDVYAYKVNMACNHCAEPACLPTCPTGAIWKRADNGVVDIDSTLCIGCRRCEAACPYGAPQWNPQAQIVQKCNMCIDELEAGRKPYCVMACMMRVLDIGPIDQLRAGTYKTTAVGATDKVVRQVKNMANPELTNPSIVFVPHSKGKVDGG